MEQTKTSTVRTRVPKADPMLGVRCPPTVRAGLDAFAVTRGKRISDVVRGKIDVYALYATEQGRDALTAIEHAVGLSTTIHKGTNEFGVEPTVDHWQGLPIANVGTEQNPRYLHYVRQREGQTRRSAIQEYAEQLWETWAKLDTDSRARELRALTDDSQHVYLIAYVNMRNWVRFPDVSEYQLWVKTYGRQPGEYETEPSNQDERAVYEYIVNRLSNTKHIASIKNSAERGVRNSVPAVCNPDLHAMYVLSESPGGKERYARKGIVFPEERPDMVVRRYAREFVREYREQLTIWDKENLTVDSYIAELELTGFYVDVITIGTNED